jgi:hypothetical protein
MPKDKQLGATLMQMRVWLDSENIDLANFRTAATAENYTFTIEFRSPQDADRFRAQFGA